MRRVGRILKHAFVPAAVAVTEVSGALAWGLPSGGQDLGSPGPSTLAAMFGLAVVLLLVVGSVGSAVVLRRRSRALERRVSERTEELEKLRGLADQINRGVTVQDVLEHIFSSFRPTIPYNRIGFALVGMGGREVQAVWARSDATKVRLPIGYRARLDGSSLQAVMESGEPRILNDLVGYLRAHPLSESTRLIVEEGMRSSLTFPLKALGKPVGFLFFSCSEVDCYDQGHVGFLQQIAGQVAMTIEKSRIYEELLATKEELEEANLRLERLATIDALTGVGNRRAFEERLATEWRRASRMGTAISLLLFDVDFFKPFNDSYGHAEGDKCLQQVARELSRGVRRASDFVARFGGEEFAAILPQTDLGDAQRLAESLRANVAALRIRHPSSAAGPWVTVSVGASRVSPGDGAMAEDLVATADRALYEAKEKGRNRVCVAASDPDLSGCAAVEG